MTTDTNNLSPQQRLAKIVAQVTDDGRRVVQFFMQVADGNLDSEGFQPNHRMDAAKELVKIGLTEFADYVPPPTPRVPRRNPTSKKPGQLSPEIEQAREELAQYARELTGDGKKVIRLYSEVMDGFRNDEGFKPHHRITAGRELLLRGFGPVPSWTQPEPVQAAPKSQTITKIKRITVRTTPRSRGPNPIREALPQEILDLIDSDDPLDECPCAIAENEDRDIPCPENEECPYYGLEFPKFTEEQSARIKEEALRGLQMCAEMLWGAPNPSEEDP